MDGIAKVVTPQLQLLHRGKVRESFRVDDRTRLVVVTDRISAFDNVLDSTIPHKGEVLEGLTTYWFDQTRDILPNHLVRRVGSRASLVREAEPIKVEVVVRGYLAGSAWRRYREGGRVMSGVKLPEGLSRNARLPRPIVTPTTKEDEGHDREVTPDEIVALGLASRELYEEMEAAALALFRRGSEVLASKGLILADTKYEMGLVDGVLTLIDEVHTPDSSRFWDGARWEADPESAESLDKEFVRAWLMEHRREEGLPARLPDEVVRETSRRYLDLYRRVTGRSLGAEEGEAGAGLDAEERLYRDLVQAGLIRDGWVAVVMGSPRDREHAEKIAAVLREHDVMVDLRVLSAHKNGEDVARFAAEYNGSLEPGAVVAVAGLSNGLGGALAANLDVPVVSCPPFADRADLMINLHSSVMMPSGVPATTAIRPEEAALAALRSLNLRRLRRRFRQDILRMKGELRRADLEMRGR